MADSITLDLARVARSIGISPEQAETAARLLQSGCSAPFIARYRRVETGRLSELQLDRLRAEFDRHERLAESKRTILDGLEARGRLSPQLVEHLAGQSDFERRVRKAFRRTARIVATKSGDDERKCKPFRDYFQFRRPAGKTPAHCILAIDRGEKAKVLQVGLETDRAAVEQAAVEHLDPATNPDAEPLGKAVRDVLTEWVLPKLEQEYRGDLTQKAEAHAVGVVGRSLRKLLLERPLAPSRVLAMDCDSHGQWTLAALDPQGQPLARGVISTQPNTSTKRERVDRQPLARGVISAQDPHAAANAGRQALAAMITEHEIQVVAIATCTATRQAVQLVSELLSDELAGRDLHYAVVNAVGAHAYAASFAGRQELPECSIEQRAAISTGRRLQDPLAELVKIDPVTLGIGLYRHFPKAKRLRGPLDLVLQSCVARVGADANHAPPALLKYIPGLNPLTAQSLVEYRAQHGPFANREALRQVPGFDEPTWAQAAGFLRVLDGTDPLDATSIHPHHYGLAERILSDMDLAPGDLSRNEAAAEFAQRASQADMKALAAKLAMDEMQLVDLLDALIHRGRDPRMEGSLPILRQAIVPLDGLSEGMELSGTVLGLVDFGAFVDVGLADASLVHISQLSTRFITHPHDVVSIGDRVKVWVRGIDTSSQRVSLTMVHPDEAKRRESQDGKGRGEQPSSGRPRPPKKSGRRGGTRQTAAAAGSGGNRSRGKTPKPRAKPKPAAPLTEAMEEGREPMRTFGDLLQFHRKKKGP